MYHNPKRTGITQRAKFDKLHSDARVFIWYVVDATQKKCFGYFLDMFDK